MLSENINKIKEAPIVEDSHILHLWSPFDLKITPEYSFVPKGFLFSILSFALSWIAYPILVIFNKLVYGFTVTGKENIKQVQGGKITVSNHVHPMDCTMNAIVNAPHQTFFPSLKSNFGIPIIRHIIKLLHAIPIPEDVHNKSKFIEVINKLLMEQKTVHFYPEGSLWPYHPNIRQFKKGAFTFAIENKIPIVPMVYTFSKPTRIYHYFKKKPCIHLSVLPAVYPDGSLPREQAIEKLQEEVFFCMKQHIKKS